MDAQKSMKQTYDSKWNFKEWNKEWRLLSKFSREPQLKHCYIYRYRLITRATFQRIQAQQAAEAQNQTVPSNQTYPAYNQAYPPVDNTYPPPVSNTTHPSTYPAPEPFGMSNKGYEDPPPSYESLKH